MEVPFKPDLEGLMIKWYIEILEFGNSFKLKKVLKAQIFVNFIAKIDTRYL